MPGPARGGGAGLGRRGCGRVDDGLAGAVIVRLSTGRRGALRSRYLDLIGLITLADRYGALLLDGGRGGIHRHLNHRRRRHGRRSGHLTAHESLIHGEGLDEEGLTRRSGDRLGLGRRGRCCRLLDGVCRRARGRVPGTGGRALRLRGGDRCDDLGLGGDGLLDLPLLHRGLRNRLGDRLAVRLGRGVLDGLGHRRRGGLLLSRLSRHVLACWSGLRSRPVSGSIGLRESRLGDRVSRGGGVLLGRLLSGAVGRLGRLADPGRLRHLAGLRRRQYLGSPLRCRAHALRDRRRRLRDGLGQRGGVDVLAPLDTHTSELAGEDLRTAEVVPDLAGTRAQAQGGGVEDGHPAVGQEAQEQPGHLTGGGVPQAHRSVLGAGEDTGAVGAPLRIGDAEAVPGQGQDDLAGNLVPDAHDAVVEAGQYPGAVGAPGVGADHGALVAQRHELAGGDDVPDVGGAVGAAGDDPGAALGPHDVAHPVAGVGVDDLAGGRVPDAGGPVLGAGQDALTVGAPGHRGDHVAVALEGEDALAAGGVPDRGAVVSQAGEDALAVRAPGDVIDVVLAGGQGLDDVAGGGIEDEDAR